ncbi:MAG: 6,7-dimethyl-8-ribityllumazine synthase [Gemmatimonadetes bacterium]|nr:6,7-dimethyl-8-ribityllumazine synthase [Gemmatimonadota bacterium]
MPEFSGERRHVGPVAVLVSRYNELVTRRLLDGALECAHEAGMTDEEIDIVWVPGAFELGAAASELAGSGRYAALVALGAVIRGDTPHFEYVAGETARALSAVAVQHAMAVAFGVLTVDTMEQATERAGGKAGNKGHEAMSAALELADVLRQVRERP